MAATAQQALTELPPWLHRPWERLQAAKAAGRLPHALLICGREGVGKNLFASVLARALLCRDPGQFGLPCGRCEGCVLTEAGTHPDVQVCEPEVDAKTDREKSVIGIDQVRAITDFVGLKPHYGGYKVVMIRPAERLNPYAANSLLKTLEEPPGMAVLMLVSAHPGMLPATIRSRCQRLLIGVPDRRATVSWLSSRLGSGTDAALLLDLAGGAPFAAFAMQEQGILARRRQMLDDLQAVAKGRADPVEIAEQWLKFGAKESLYWLYVWLVDMVRLQAADEPPILNNPDQRDRLAGLSAGADIRRLLGRMDQVLNAMRAGEGQANPQLLLEEALISWLEIAA